MPNIDKMNTFKNTRKLNNKPTKLHLILAITCLIIGLGIIVGISFYEGLKSIQINRFNITTGTVVDYKVFDFSYSNSNVHESYLYAEIAEFEVNGKKYTVTNSVDSSHITKNIGDSITIAYNPENPLDCVFIASSNKIFIILLALFGVLFTGVSVVLLIYYSQQYKEWKKSISK